MADTTKLLMLGGAAAAGYWFFLRPGAAFAGAFSSTPAAVTPVVTLPDPNAIKGANSADGIYALLVKAAQDGGQMGPGATLNVDQWNYYLGQVAPQLGLPPNPGDVFGTIGGFSATQPLTASQYWAKMAPYLKTNRGLSGIGLMGLLGCLRCERAMR